MQLHLVYILVEIFDFVLIFHLNVYRLDWVNMVSFLEQCFIYLVNHLSMAKTGTFILFI